VDCCTDGDAQAAICSPPCRWQRDARSATAAMLRAGGQPALCDVLGQAAVHGLCCAAACFTQPECCEALLAAKVRGCCTVAVCCRGQRCWVKEVWQLQLSGCVGTVQQLLWLSSMHIHLCASYAVCMFRTARS
jgi:hypothetical protein